MAQGDSMDRRARALARGLLVGACAISAGVHAALTPEHVREGPAPGAGFLVSALLLGLLCVTLTLLPDGRLAPSAAAVVLVGLVAAYALATTTGLPALHPEAEPAARLGLATKAIELVGLAAAVGLALPGRTAGRLTRLQPKGTTT